MCGTTNWKNWVQAAEIPRLFTPPLPRRGKIADAIQAVAFAGFWRRAVALVIDLIVITIVSSIWFAACHSTAKTPEGKEVLASVLAFMVSFFYYVRCESGEHQATWGKRALGLAVTDLRGKPISGWRATLRYLARIFSGLTLGIGYLMAGFTAKKQALHDIVAGCLVIRKPDAWKLPKQQRPLQSLLPQERRWPF